MTFLAALTAALRAFPLWLALLVTREIVKLTKQIIAHEAANTPADARMAGELRIYLAYYIRLHDALCTTVPALQGRDGGANVTRAVPVAE
jgi:hypothetical protein